MRGVLLVVLITIVATSEAHVVFGQDSSELSRPVTALYADGDRLLIGQGSILLEAQITSSDLVVQRSVDLGRHEIRSIAVKDGLTLILSEDGLTTLSASGEVVDYAQGGGQRLAIKFGRAYVAARALGVRVLTIDTNGKLTSLGTLQTLGPAVDLAPEGDSWLWVAEGNYGVRLYDLANPTSARLLLWLGDLAPATAVRVNGPRVLVGHGNKASLIDTINIQAPHLLSTIDIGGPEAQVSDILIQGNRVYIGRTASDAPDVTVLDISAPKVIKAIARVGDSGAGENLVLHDSDLFLGSAKMGLRRFQVAADSTATLITEWKVADRELTCSPSAPAEPEPPNLGESPAGSVTLTWTSACAPLHYEIRVNGTVAGQTDKASYTFTPHPGIVSWQITAIDSAGKRVDGPVWFFESVQEGWLATPIPIRPSAALYMPETSPISLKSPGGVLAATCLALSIGLVVVAGGAWGIGALAERRALRRE